MEIVDSTSTPRCVHLDSGCWRALFKEGALCAKAHNACMRHSAFQGTRSGLCFSGGNVAAGAVGPMALLRGQAEVIEAASDTFWTWRRTLLAIGYVLALVAGVQLLLEADPTGLILMVAGVLGLLFLHRTWVGLVVWAYVAASGLVAIISADDLGLYGLAAGAGFGLIALPWRPREPVLPRGPVYWTQQEQPAQVVKQANGAPAPHPYLPTEVQRHVEAHMVEQSPPATPTAPGTPSNGDGHAQAQRGFPGALLITPIGKTNRTRPWKDPTRG